MGTYGKSLIHKFKIGLFKVQMPMSMNETSSLVLNCFKNVESNFVASFMGAKVAGPALLAIYEFLFFVEMLN